jgi:hypothetical protein
MVPMPECLRSGDPMDHTSDLDTPCQIPAAYGLGPLLPRCTAGAITETGRVNNPARNVNRSSVEQCQQASQLAHPQRASENKQAQENVTSGDQKRQKQPGLPNARQADGTEHSNHEHILDDEEFDV